MMKTRYVRLNKLNPLLNRQKQSINFNGLQTEGNSDSLKNMSARKEAQPRSNELVGMIQETIRRQLKLIHNSIEHEARDCFVQTDLPQYGQDQSIDDQVLKQWMTEVCNNVFSAAFNFFSKDHMSLQHTKIFCSECILRNIFRLTQKFNLSINQMKVLNEHLEKDIVPYMQRKYPLTESSDVNKAIDQCVRPIDNRQALNNDILQKTGIVFSWRKNGDYNDLIMRLLNWIMQEIDVQNEKEDTPYEEFYNTMSDLFENVYDESWMKSKTLQQYANLNSSEIKKMRMTKHESLNLESKISQEKYANRVKEYTSYAINRKISKNTPIFTEQQIKSGHLNIKNSAILRILTKWCQELWKKFTTKNYFLDRQQNLRVQEVGGNVNTMFMWMKLPLNDMMEKEKKRIDAFMKEVTEHNFDQQSLLLLKELEDDGFTHVEKIERACGKYAIKTVNNLHFYITLYLNRVIHGLLTVSKQLYEQKLSTKNRWTSPPDLMSFKIGDLMRCKCSSKERQILKIFKQLQKMSQKQPHLIKIIRVKNRLKMGTNDILINIMFQEKFICQIQLAVKSATSKFIQCSNMFSHYIYELGRTLFGPITELCSVWMSLDARALEYSRIVSRQKRNRRHMVNKYGCALNGKQHYYESLKRPFICNECKIAFSSTNYIWSHEKCIQCGYLICALCRIQDEEDSKLKKQILVKQDQNTKNACKTIVNRNGLKILPEYGLCIKINSKRIMVQKFRKLQIKNILSVYGIKKDKDTGQEKIYLIKQLIKQKAELNFLKEYLVFEICGSQGPELINITEERVKKQYLIPQKVRDIYKKQKEIFSLIEQNLTDKDFLIAKQEPKFMEKIKNMEMADNQLTRVEFITENFPNLIRLQLSRNRLQNIDTISKLKKIAKLNLRDNKLKSLPDQICQLVGLKSLNIRNNEISELPSRFGNFVKMDKLQADNNKLSTLPKGFENMTKMNFLTLSKNKLTEFPEEIRCFKKIATLKIASNKWSTIPEWIEQLTELQLLDIYKTSATNLPEGLFSLKKLQFFKLSTTHDKLSSKIANLINLKELSLQMPSITSLPNQMRTLQELELLQLQECKISELPDWLSDMKRLISFSLINNKINTLSLEVNQMVKLRSLKIEGQNISELPQQLKQLTELRTLSLNNNKFKKIPDVIRNFHKVFELTLSNNELEELPEDLFENLLQIQTLILDKNKLKTLPKSLCKLKKIKKLSYQGNPEIKEPDWIEIVNETMTQVMNMTQLTMKFQDSVLKQMF